MSRSLSALSADVLWPELYFWQPLFSGASAAGMDINESIAIQVQRHLELIRMVTDNGFIEAFDWASFDHWCCTRELRAALDTYNEELENHFS